MVLATKNSGVNSWQRKEIFLHSVQRDSEAHSASCLMSISGPFPRGKLMYLELTTHLHLVPKLKCMELYLHSFTLGHGVVLNEAQESFTFHICYLHFIEILTTLVLLYECLKVKGKVVPVRN
jgi:hypothetical protein